jgi:hypothetical protein
MEAEMKALGRECMALILALAFAADAIDKSSRESSGCSNAVSVNL